MSRNNAARRVHDVLQKAAGGQDSVPAATIWAEAFGIQHNGPDFDFEVIEALRHVKEELEAVRTFMEASTISPDCYRDY